MITEKQLLGCQKFSFPLKAHSETKKIFEAKKVLADIYPFEVKSENIFISKASKKGFYDVYISNEKIKKTRNTVQYLLILMSIIFIGICFSFIVHYEIEKNEKFSIAQKEYDRQELENQKIQKEKEIKLESLKKEYNEKKYEQYEKIYPYIKRIYSVMLENSTIENILIEKNLFSVEVTTNDAMKILENFESNEAFCAIKMNRTTVKDGIETVTYSGLFSKFWKEADVSLSIDEKLNFYGKELELINLRAERMQTLQLSEYIRGIRETLRKAGCSEQYIQLRGKEKSTEVEFFILSSSRDILNFINKIQERENNLVDIKQIRIRNSVERDRLQTTICFDSGIMPKQNGDSGLFSEYEDQKIDLSEIDKIFYKVPISNSPVKKVQRRQSIMSVQESQSFQMKKLLYIGLTKTGGKALVIVKDDDMDVIYKLVLSECEIDGDFCIKTDSGYKAKIHNEYYEVKK